MKRIATLLLLALMPIAVFSAPSPKKIIFDTDMGNDVDDVIALDMLYKYADMGKIDLRGIVSSKREIGSVQFIDAMNVAYGHPDIPIGITKTFPEENYKCPNKRLNFATYVMSKFDFRHAVQDYEALPDGYKLLRKLLAESGGDVTIIAVGFSTNLARLLKSGADEYSDLDGRTLVEKNVSTLVMMAGNFHAEKKEYNIYNDRTSATIVLETWPTEILFTDFELGRTVYFPYTSVENNFTYLNPHPAYEAFCRYSQMPYNRPMWDATAVLFAVEPSSKFFSLSKRGYVTVNEANITYFYRDKKGMRRYYESTDIQKMNIVRRLTQLTSIRPKADR